MTISTTDNKTIYQGDGAQTVFNFTKPFQNASEVIVILRDETTATAPVETTQTSGVDYNVSGSSGNYDITFVTAPTANDKVIIKRVSTLNQSTDYNDNQQYSVESVETDLDKSVLIDQQQALLQPRVF